MWYPSTTCSGTWWVEDRNTNTDVVTKTPYVPTTLPDPPASIDWRNSIYMTEVKDQGQCGSCWAFASTAMYESVIAIKTQTQAVRLSEQELVDCNTQNSGCNGGSTKRAFDYIASKKGLLYYADYPYQGVRGTCQTSSTRRTTKYPDMNYP